MPILTIERKYMYLTTKQIISETKSFVENYERFGFQTAFNELANSITAHQPAFIYFINEMPMQISATPEFQRWQNSWLKHYAKQN